MKDELDEQFECSIPVLLTSELLYKVLLSKEIGRKSAKEFYLCAQGATIPIPSEENQLNRPLIPFYRHLDYKFNNGKWEKYRQTIISYLENHKKN